MRREYQQQLEEDIFGAEGFRDRLFELPSSLPIVLWTTRAWSDRLSLWWVAEMIRHLEVGIERLWICEPRSPECSDPQLELPLGAFAEHKLAAALTEARRMTSQQLDAAARLWRAFADSDPRGFDELRRTASPCFPSLLAELEPHRYGFPRVAPDRRLLLSELDDLLLHAMERDEWVRPVDILIGTPAENRVLRFYRDHFVAYRLHQWYRHERGAPILVAESREGANSLTRVAYRLTDRGRALLSLGLTSLEDGASMEIGGCCAYGSPWVARTVPGGWSIDDQNGTIPQVDDDPHVWARIRAELDIGVAVRGTVICRRPFGVFLDIGYGVHAPALLLVPEFAQGRSRRIEFDDFPHVGAAINARVLHIDWDRHKIALTQNPAPDLDSLTGRRG